MSSTLAVLTLLASCQNGLFLYFSVKATMSLALLVAKGKLQLWTVHYELSVRVKNPEAEEASIVSGSQISLRRERRPRALSVPGLGTLWLGVLERCLIGVSFQA